MKIYLNFDGVLHPNHVTYRYGTNPELVAPGHRPLEYAPILAAAIEPYPDVEIVLNTWWTLFLGIDASIALLPATLARRVVDSTLHEARQYTKLPSRLLQAEMHVASGTSHSVILLDHADVSYSATHASAVLTCSCLEGLSGVSELRCLTRRLRLLCTTYDS
ncbi:HAD domain-containing protein [Paraburkholderia sabiae]|uniref:HAD domain-containing protein n=1 Tax=Paraburkholderia sabiae TaxID=273251 RepID=UPI001CC447E5